MLQLVLSTFSRHRVHLIEDKEDDDKCKGKGELVNVPCVSPEPQAMAARRSLGSLVTPRLFLGSLVTLRLFLGSLVTPRFFLGSLVTPRLFLGSLVTLRDAVKNVLGDFAR